MDHEGYQVRHPKSRVRLSLAVGAGTLLLILGVACAAPRAPETPTPAPSIEIVVEDALGRTVTLDGPPQRIVIAGKANFMLNDAIYAFPEAKERVVALTQAKQTTAPFLSFLDPNYETKLSLTLESTAEQIAATRPDLVFLKQMMQESVGNALEEVGIPVVYLSLETPEQYEHDIAVLGRIFANVQRADEIHAFYQSRMDRISEALEGTEIAAHPSALVLQTTTEGEAIAFEIPPAGFIQTRMVELSGGDPVWSQAGAGGWTVVGLEQIAAWNPDRIFIISYFGSVADVIARLNADPAWQGLTAVQQGQVFGFPGDFYSWDQPDTRWILGLTWMATKMHPEQFADVDMGREIQEFYGELYGLDAATVEAEVLPLLVGDVTR
ncbi:MAG: ABC transporter substrate-binding protein [Anaerolineae bacterium]|nr:ABC transporter substrate-binding protein [Anaerolineae bacterium]